MAQSTKPQTLDLGSGHDLMVCGTEPHTGLCAGGVEPAWDFLSPLSAPPPAHVHKLSLSLLK